MARLPKALQFLIMAAMACLIAGLYGALHNQISYTIGPEYFHALKFAQFHIASDVPPRTGAALVGWRASWWVGLVAGLPLFTLALCVAGGRAAYARLCRNTIALLMAGAMAGAASGLALAYASVTPDTVGLVVDRSGLMDPIGFARAGAMHDGSYIGATLGLLIAAIRMTLGTRPDG